MKLDFRKTIYKYPAIKGNQNAQKLQITTNYLVEK